MKGQESKQQLQPVFCQSNQINCQKVWFLIKLQQIEFDYTVMQNKLLNHKSNRIQKQSCESTHIQILPCLYITPKKLIKI